MINTLTPNEDLKPSKYTPISFYPKLTDKTSTPIPWETVFELVKTGTGFKNTIQKLRNESDKAKQDSIKKTLPAITVSGLFGESRKGEHLIQHSGFIQLDFDNVLNIRQASLSLQRDEYTFLAFISPSGNGIKLIVKIPPNKDTHITYFNQLNNYYFKTYQLEVDKQCKDITRLLFLSWDEHLFINESSKVWTQDDPLQTSKFEMILQALQKKESFTTGKRNDFVFKLACECCKAGIEISNIISEINKRFCTEDFTISEIDRTVKSAYNAKTKSTDSEQKDGVSYSLLKRAEIYLENKYDIRLNEVSGRIEYKPKGENVIFKELNENNIFRELQHSNIPLSMPKIGALLLSDFVTKYDPFLDYFESLGKWDERKEPDFIDKLCEYLPVADSDRFKLHFKKMLVRCIACALEPGTFNKQVFVLVGEGQNTGKSTFCRWLCPPVLADYITEYVNTDKDGLIVLATMFIINMDELAALSKAEINSLKSFISKDKINIRLPFAKRSSAHPRRANFIGSTNNDEFLTDETGSVRWLCFELTGAINFAYKTDIDINDVWRQAYTLYKSGFSYQLSIAEIKENETANSRFHIDSIEIQLIRKYYTPASKEDGKFVQASDVWSYIVQRNGHVKTNVRNIGKALKVLGFKKVTFYDPEKKFTIYGYYVKENPE